MPSCQRNSDLIVMTRLLNNILRQRRSKREDRESMLQLSVLISNLLYISTIDIDSLSSHEVNF